MSKITLTEMFCDDARLIFSRPITIEMQIVEKGWVLYKSEETGIETIGCDHGQAQRLFSHTLCTKCSDLIDLEIRLWDNLVYSTARYYFNYPMIVEISRDGEKWCCEWKNVFTSADLTRDKAISRLKKFFYESANGQEGTYIHDKINRLVKRIQRVYTVTISLGPLIFKDFKADDEHGAVEQAKSVLQAYSLNSIHNDNVHIKHVGLSVASAISYPKVVAVCRPMIFKTPKPPLWEITFDLGTWMVDGIVAYDPDEAKRIAFESIKRNWRGIVAEVPYD